MALQNLTYKDIIQNPDILRNVTSLAIEYLSGQNTKINPVEITLSDNTLTLEYADPSYVMINQWQDYEIFQEKNEVAVTPVKHKNKSKAKNRYKIVRYELPSFIKTMHMLTKISITELPRQFNLDEALLKLTALSHIKEFRMQKMPFFVLKEFSIWHNLEILSLINSGIKNIPDIFSNMKKLHTLTLWDNNITELPESLYDCHQLTYLDCANNQLETIAPSISKLTSLQKLDIRSNKLTKLPETMKQLSHLKFLFVADNYFDNNITRLLPKWLSHTTIDFTSLRGFG